jgi:hypothetical protein
MRHTSLFSLKELGATVVLSFAATCAVIAATDRSAADGMRAGAIHSGTITVNRTNKGDRLVRTRQAPPLSSSVSPVTPPTPTPVPFGCDRAFSPVADPAGANVFLRCLS